MNPSNIIVDIRIQWKCVVLTSTRNSMQAQESRRLNFSRFSEHQLGRCSVQTSSMLLRSTTDVYKLLCFLISVWWKLLCGVQKPKKLACFNILACWVICVLFFASYFQLYTLSFRKYRIFCILSLYLIYDQPFLTSLCFMLLTGHVIMAAWVMACHIAVARRL